MGEAVISRCGECQEEVVDGPQGGYCCGKCGHSVDPPAVVSARYAAERERHRLVREQIRAELKATRPRTPRPAARRTAPATAGGPEADPSVR